MAYDDLEKRSRNAQLAAAKKKVESRTAAKPKTPWTGSSTATPAWTGSRGVVGKAPIAGSSPEALRRNAPATLRDVGVITGDLLGRGADAGRAVGDFARRGLTQIAETGREFVSGATTGERLAKPDMVTRAGRTGAKILAEKPNALDARSKAAVTRTTATQPSTQPATQPAGINGIPYQKGVSRFEGFENVTPGMISDFIGKRANARAAEMESSLPWYARDDAPEAKGKPYATQVINPKRGPMEPMYITKMVEPPDMTSGRDSKLRASFDRALREGYSVTDADSIARTGDLAREGLSRKQLSERAGQAALGPEREKSQGAMNLERLKQQGQTVTAGQGETVTDLSGRVIAQGGGKPVSISEINSLFESDQDFTVKGPDLTAARDEFIQYFSGSGESDLVSGYADWKNIQKSGWDISPEEIMSLRQHPEEAEKFHERYGFLPSFAR